VIKEIKRGLLKGSDLLISGAEKSSSELCTDSSFQRCSLPSPAPAFSWLSSSSTVSRTGSW